MVIGSSEQRDTAIFGLFFLSQTERSPTGYPELGRVEDRLGTFYRRLARRSLRHRLAFTLGFETATNGFTAWLVNERRELFGNACPYVASFWLMHMVEESEHRNVAFDAYMACFGAYLPRVFGLLSSTTRLLWAAVLALTIALRKDGVLFSVRGLRECAVELAALLRFVAPPILRGLSPRYNPRREPEPAWIREWAAGHALLGAGEPLPLIDTHSVDLPVPFGSATNAST